MKTFFINVQEPYLGYMLSGRKTIEGRLNKGKFKEIEIDDVINVNNLESFKVIGKRIYNSFREMIEKEGIDKIIPDKKTIEAAVAVYYRFYNSEDEKKFGVVALEIFKITFEMENPF